MPKFTGYIPNAVDILESGKTWLFASDALINSSGQGIYEQIGTQDNVVTVAGTVLADGFALLLAGLRTELTVKASALLVGTSGIVTFADGDHQVIKTAGHIIATEVGLAISGTNNHATNNGLVEAPTGYQDDEFENILVNGRDGRIIASLIGIDKWGVTGDVTFATNHGLIEAPVVYSGNASDDTFLNTGRLEGNVELGAGNDTFKMLGGKLIGTAAGGTGDDTYIAGVSKVTFLEMSGEGEDKIRASVSFAIQANIESLILIGKRNINGIGDDAENFIYGNSGNNLLSGGLGADTLDGKGGNDRLRGGATADFFQFGTNYDRDTLLDFESGTDHILLDWNGIGDFADVKRHAHNIKGGVEIEFGGDALIIKGMRRQDLDMTDFLI